MKKFTLIALLLSIVTLINCSENNQNDEQEIRTLMAQYDEASLKNDLAFFDKMLAPEYFIITPGGNTSDREAALKFLRDEKEKPTYKLISLKSDSLQIKMVGDMAIVNGKWLATTQAIDDPSPVMHKDEGRFTSILEKRNGQWMMVTEHVSENPHNKKEAELLLKEASDSYDKGLLAKDNALFSSLFAEDYTSTNEDGKVSNKTDDIAQIMSADLVFLTAKTEDKNFRLYRDTAVETGTFSASGIYKKEPFSESGRYTTTWIYRDGKWKIVSDHTSSIPVTK